jgi:ribonuclease P protein component
LGNSAVLDPAHRLRKRQDFTTVFQRGGRHQTRHLVLQSYLRTPKVGDIEAPTRIGISISQKVSKRAVVRNRIKRQLRAICRIFLKQLMPGWDLVIIVRARQKIQKPEQMSLPQQSSGLECDYQQFLRELKQLLAEAKVLNGD